MNRKDINFKKGDKKTSITYDRLSFLVAVLEPRI